LTGIRLAVSGNRFYIPCAVRGRGEVRLHALVDTGASVTAVRGDICRSLGLRYLGTRAVTCVHGAHADTPVKRYLGTLVIGERARYLVIHELGRLEEDGDVIDAILGRDVLEDYLVTLDWPCMSGSLGE